MYWVCSRVQHLCDREVQGLCEGAAPASLYAFRPAYCLPCLLLFACYTCTLACQGFTLAGWWVLVAQVVGVDDGIGHPTWLLA